MQTSAIDSREERAATAGVGEEGTATASRGREPCPQARRRARGHRQRMP
jgi:hypothetical protein